MKMALVWILLIAAAGAAFAASVRIERDNRWIVNDKPYFAFGISGAPQADLKAPDGGDGWKELASAGINWMRIGGADIAWDDAGVAKYKAIMDAAARVGIFGQFNLRDLSSLPDDPPLPPPYEGGEEGGREAKLRQVVTMFKDHPATLAWKGIDEPAWGKQPVPPMLRAYKLIKELDPMHPVIVTHAPRNTLRELRAYNPTCDVTGLDIYPVSVPMGKHGHFPNRQISVVGDYTKWMVELAEGKKPILMILQITYSGTTPPKNILVRPTFDQQRYMTYQAIIDGANGIMWFGGYIVLNERDEKLGFNWTYFDEVLRPLLKEIGPGSELYSVITATASSNVALKVEGAEDIELLARKVNGNAYILAAKREGPEATVRISGLTGGGEADVMFENRKVKLVNGVIEDTFKPNAVHVYRVR